MCGAKCGVNLIFLEIIGGSCCHVQGHGPAYVYVVVCVFAFLFVNVRICVSLFISFLS